MLKLISSIILALVCFRAHAQLSFGYSNLPEIQVQNNGNWVSLLNPWQGGFNNPQPNLIDLNNDNLLDLAVFDRGNNRVSCFLRSGEGLSTVYTYHAYYSSLFPYLTDWMILKDIDCDSKPDLFSIKLNALAPRLLKNVGNGNGARFVTRDSLLLTTTFSGTPTQLILNTGDFPSIVDIDNDGDLDFVCQEFTGSGFELHLNQARDSGVGNACNFSRFKKITNCFGGLASTFTCGNYQQLNCRIGADRDLPNGRVAHVGATITIEDVTGDGRPDLLAGDVGCSNLYVLPNTSASGYSFSTTPLAPFPNATNPAVTQDYPASFVMDIDGDGQKDLLVAPNSTSSNSNYNTFQNSFFYYKNQSNAAGFNFQLIANNFLQNTTLDFGFDARPAIGDVDGDGLQDILVGCGGFRNSTAATSSIAFIKNIGTSTAPVFRLMTTDWQGLSSSNRPSMQPELIDLDLDGALDLVLGYDTGRSSHQVLFYKNGNAVGAALSFDFTQFKPLRGPNWLPFDSPAFVDVDQDGLLDLLVGRYNATVLHYRNTGTNANPVYSLITNKFVGINFLNQGVYDLNIWVADVNADSNPDLVTIDQKGTLRAYMNIRNRGSDSLVPETRYLRDYLAQNAETTPLGSRAHPALGDLNGDGLQDMLLGQSSGGLTLYWNTLRSTPTSTTPTVAVLQKLVIAPNPTLGEVQVAIPESGTLQIIDAQGRTIKMLAVEVGNQQISLSQFAAGYYHFQLITTSGRKYSAVCVKE